MGFIKVMKKIFRSAGQFVEATVNASLHLLAKTSVKIRRKVTGKKPKKAAGRRTKVKRDISGRFVHRK